MFYISIKHELGREGSVHHYFYILRRPTCCFLPWTWKKRKTEITAWCFMQVKNTSHLHHTNNWCYYWGLAVCQGRCLSLYVRDLIGFSQHLSVEMRLRVSHCPVSGLVTCRAVWALVCLAAQPTLNHSHSQVRPLLSSHSGSLEVDGL